MSPKPTIRDVAERAGLSVATVSRAMNDKGDVSEAARRRVHEAASALGYAPDAAGRALASGRTQRVGVVIGDNSGHPDLSVTFFGKVVAAISRRLSVSGYETLLLDPGESPLDPKHRHALDAAILIGIDDGEAREFAELHVPCVGVDVICDWLGSAWVGCDHVEGVRLAVRHLYALGHRRIAHIAGGANTVAGAGRLEAFRNEVALFGLELPEEYVRHGDFSSSSGYRETCALLALPEPPTAIVSASDLMALAALQAVRDFHLEPGKDVAVVGFDDIEPAALSHPPLTTIRQDRSALGSLAAERVIDLIEHPDAPPSSTLVPVELVVRGSTGS